MSELVYRSMTLPDIEQVYEIECSCFSQPWSVESLIGEVIRNDAASYVVAEDNGKIVGYAGMWQMFDEAHMTNIAVAAEYRCRGIATNLILCLMQTAKAQRVYSALGFRYAGTRRKYYSDTGENALILWNDSIDNTLRAHADGSCSESL